MTIFNPCASNPCFSGVCVPFGNNFACNCNFGYSGQLCNIVINNCASNPCRNGGQCNNLIGTYVI